MVPGKETVPGLPAAPTHPRSRDEASLPLTWPPGPFRAGRGDLISSSLVSLCHIKFTDKETPCVVSWRQRSLQISWPLGRQAARQERSRSHMKARGAGVQGGHGSRRPPRGEGTQGGCQPSRLQRASLIAQLVKNLPETRETPVQFLGREDPLEKGTATHSGILAWRIPWTTVHWVAKNRTQQSIHFKAAAPEAPCSCGPVPPIPRGLRGVQTWKKTTLQVEDCLPSDPEPAPGGPLARCMLWKYISRSFPKWMLTLPF